MGVVQSRKISMTHEKRIARINQINAMCDTQSAMRQEADNLAVMIAAAEKLRNTAILRWLAAGITNKEVAYAFGLTPSRVSQIKAEALYGPKVIQAA